MRGAFVVDIIDLQAERDKRAVRDLLQDKKEFKGFAVDLDLCKQNVIFSGHAIGSAGEERLSVIIYDDPGPHVYSRHIGTIRFNPAQWREMVKFGSRMLKAHTDLTKK